MVVDDAICIVGAKGMLGRELVRLSHEERLRVPPIRHALDVEEIDIADAGRVFETLERLRPRILINAAAYTDVDGCESHEDLAWAVNADGPANLARACAACRCRLIHVSTDYVFDGSRSSPWLPNDPVRPLSAYGRSKAAGDESIRRILPDHAIVRTSWLFGVHGRNFVKTILRLAGERDELTVVTDQIGRPTYAADLAETLLRLSVTRHCGTYHFANSGVCSWNEFAQEIIRLSGGRIRVLPMTTAELARPAARPAYSVLDTDRIERDLAIRPRHWKEALAECVAILRQPARA